MSRPAISVERRLMRQWMLKITAYADRLLEDLEDLDWPEGIKAMQRNWIGRSEGAEVTFRVDGSSASFERLHDPARHAVRRHLLRAGARASDRRSHHDRPAAGRRRRLSGKDGWRRATSSAAISAGKRPAFSPGPMPSIP